MQISLRESKEGGIISDQRRQWLSVPSMSHSAMFLPEVELPALPTQYAEERDKPRR